MILSHVHCQGLLPRPAQPRLDALLGALGWMVENVLLLRAIDHERQPPLDIHTAVDEVADPGKVFDLTLPLDQAPEGYQAMDERRATKVLLTP